MSTPHHVDTVMGIVGGGNVVPSGNEAELIQQSWLRCFNDYGLNPAGRPRMRVESSTRLRERREQHERFLQTARAGMERLYRHFADLDYVLMLADADGVTLDHIGDPASDSPIRDSLVPGADWGESHAGTNGIGTCLVEQRTLSCHRDDHFYAGNLDLSCTASPLYTPSGELLGALDASGITTTPKSAHASRHLAQHLTALYARMIEDAYFMLHFEDQWIIKLATISALVDVNADMMLAFDKDGVIVGANSGARRDLHVLGDPARGSLVGNGLSAAFRNTAEDIWRLTRGAGAGDRALLEDWAGTRYYATLRAPRFVPGSPQPAQTVPVTDTTALEQLGRGDPQISQLIDLAGKLVARPINILIQGETGTGKEVLARALHDSSPRADKPFVAVNCAAIPESLIESELFGYQPGTFTGARNRGMVGLIQRSDGGTLFLDEIGDMPLALQTRLLRVLSEGEVLPLGAEKPIALQLTVIAASHQNLAERIRDGRFREDLYYRLRGATLRLPPLRERQDRVALIRRLLHEEAQGESELITPQALELLNAYSWPGNVRELRNALRYALSLAETRGIEIAHLPPEVREGAVAAAPLPAALLQDSTTTDSAAPPSESDRLLEALRSHHWNITAVSRELNLCRATVYRRMKRFGIVPPTRYC